MDILSSNRMPVMCVKKRLLGREILIDTRLYIVASDLMPVMCVRKHSV